MKKQLKHYVAEKLISWSFSIMPDCKMKDNLAKFIIENFNKLENNG